MARIRFGGNVDSWRCVLRRLQSRNGECGEGDALYWRIMNIEQFTTNADDLQYDFAQKSSFPLCFRLHHLPCHLLLLCARINQRWQSKRERMKKNIILKAMAARDNKFHLRCHLVITHHIVYLLRILFGRRWWTKCRNRIRCDLSTNNVVVYHILYLYSSGSSSSSYATLYTSVLENAIWKENAFMHLHSARQDSQMPSRPWNLLLFFLLCIALISLFTDRWWWMLLCAVCTPNCSRSMRKYQLLALQRDR